MRGIKPDKSISSLSSSIFIGSPSWSKTWIRYAVNRSRMCFLRHSASIHSSSVSKGPCRYSNSSRRGLTNPSLDRFVPSRDLTVYESLFPVQLYIAQNALFFHIHIGDKKKELELMETKKRQPVVGCLLMIFILSAS